MARYADWTTLRKQRGLSWHDAKALVYLHSYGGVSLSPNLKQAMQDKSPTGPKVSAVVLTAVRGIWYTYNLIQEVKL